MSDDEQLHKWVARHLRDAPVRSEEFWRNVARIYGFHLDDAPADNDRTETR